MEELAAQVCAEHVKTGRDVREILDAMRDEGYIGCTDDVLDQLATIATNLAASDTSALR